MSSKTTREQLKEEMKPLVFARVSRIVLKDEFKQTKDDKVVYTHYYGFAKIENGASVSGLVWFKMATHLSRNDGFFFGPVSHSPNYTEKTSIPKRGDTVVGKIVASTKGNAYVWWTHDALPFSNFRAFVDYPKKLNNEPRAFSMLKINSKKNTCDDLYMFAQIAIKQNINLLVSQFFEPNNQSRHPWLKDESGYQRKRGFLLEYNPVEIAYFTSLFVKDKTIYEKFLEELKKNESKILTWPQTFLNNYTLERLEEQIKNCIK